LKLCKRNTFANLLPALDRVDDRQTGLAQLAEEALVVNTAPGPGAPRCCRAPGRPVAEALAGAHQGKMLRVEVEAVIISEGESEAVRARNGG
jgi:hypothetical protein